MPLRAPPQARGRGPHARRPPRARWRVGAVHGRGAGQAQVAAAGGPAGAQGWAGRHGRHATLPAPSSSTSSCTSARLCSSRLRRSPPCVPIADLPAMCNFSPHPPPPTPPPGCRQDGTGDDGNTETCVLCGVGGSLLCCDGCPAAYHLRCINETSKSIPEGDWMCPECSIGTRGEPAADQGQGQAGAGRPLACLRSPGNGCNRLRLRSDRMSEQCSALCCIRTRKCPSYVPCAAACLLRGARPSTHPRNPPPTGPALALVQARLRACGCRWPAAAGPLAALPGPPSAASSRLASPLRRRRPRPRRRSARRAVAARVALAAAEQAWAAAWATSGWWG